MQEKKYTVKEASRITGIPVTTIQYWLKANIINTDKDPNNGYNLFSKNDLWLLIDRAHSRNIGISLKIYNDLLDINSWQKLYEDSYNNLLEQKLKIEEQMDILQTRMNRLNEIGSLEKKIYFKSEPPEFRKLVEYDFTNPTLQNLYQTSTTNIATFVELNNELEEKKYIGISVPQDFAGGKLLWTRDANENFYAALIKRDINEHSDSTVSILKTLQNDGLKPIYMIVYSLACSYKNGIDYFKAYIKVDKM